MFYGRTDLLSLVGLSGHFIFDILLFFLMAQVTPKNTKISKKSGRKMLGKYFQLSKKNKQTNNKQTNKQKNFQSNFH